MSFNEWNTAYTKINNKLCKKAPLSSEELDELLDLIEKIKDFTNKVEYEVIKRQ